MDEKTLKSLKIFFITINSAYQIADVFGGMKDNKNQESLKHVVFTILEILKDDKPNEDSLKYFLKEYEKYLEIEINIKTPKFPDGGVYKH